MNARECGLLSLGFFLGATVGAAMGVLAAPQSGARTRRKLVRAGEQLRDDLAERGEDLVERGREAADQAKRKLQAVSAQAG